MDQRAAAQRLRRGEEGAAECLLEVHRIAQDSMREVRRIAGGYRSAEPATELAGARAVLRAAGIEVRVSGYAGLPDPARTALWWALREAATKVLRHADPTVVRIGLAVEAADPGSVAVLRVDNDGVPAGASVAGPVGGTAGGWGLVGLRERLLAMDGDLAAHPRPGGRFHLRARVPLSSAPPVTDDRPHTSAPSSSSACSSSVSSGLSYLR